MGSMAGAYDITDARQGSELTRTLTFAIAGVGQDLTGWLARMQVRKFPSSGDPLLLDLSSDSGGITWVDRTHGTFKIDIPATAMTDVASGDWSYDLELVPPANPGPGYDETKAFALIAGTVSVAAQTTRVTP